MAPKRSRESFFRNNGLLIAFAAMMLVATAIHGVTGWKVDTEQREEEGLPALTLDEYLQDSHFLSSLFENWESEFLQMALFVLLTVSLRQKGSSESRPMDPSEEERKTYPVRDQPWPVRRGGLWLKLYEHSLSASLFLLFLGSFVGHWISSWFQYSEAHADKVPTLIAYLASADLWFESMQNWQSEFLAVFAIVFLSIYLREKHSSQSKQVEAPHSKTAA